MASLDPVPRDTVADVELLYRRVPDRAENFPIDAPSGIRRLSSTAFSDRYFHPSVDRADLCEHKPAHVQSDPTDGVVSLCVHQIRTIEAVRNDANGREVQRYIADVEPNPLNGNKAHAEILVNPAISSETKTVFKKIIERLSRLAVMWEIAPKSCR